MAFSGQGDDFNNAVEAEKLAFTKVYSLHWRELCAIAARLTRNKEVAEDIVQEVFLAFLKKDENLKIENVRAYLIQTLKYQCFNWFRHAKIAKEHLQRMDRAVFENYTENEINLAFTDDAVHQVVSTMPDRCREVFELSRFKHLSNEEIATQLKINQRTVENHLTRALKILRDYLKFLLLFLPGMQF